MGPEIGEMPRTSGSVCREDNVSGHKFKIGQTVRYAAPFSHSAAADYKITLLLPTEDNELQYRIKSANEPHEPVAKESTNSSERLTNGYPTRADRCFRS
jgi:hypothetical protein